MIVLHAGVFEGQLLLWGETPFNPDAPPRRKQRRKENLPAEVYPYDAGKEGLQAALAEAGMDFSGKGQPFAPMVAWLPTGSKTPLPSSPLIAEPPEPPGQITFAPWAVTGLPLSPRQALEFLCACMGKQALASGIVIGKDLGFWAAAVRFAGSLVAICHRS